MFPLVLPLEFCFAEVSSTLENDAGILKTKQPACCVSYLISSVVAASFALCNANILTLLKEKNGD